MKGQNSWNNFASKECWTTVVWLLHWNSSPVFLVSVSSASVGSSESAGLGMQMSEKHHCMKHKKKTFIISIVKYPASLSIFIFS